MDIVNIFPTPIGLVDIEYQFTSKQKEFFLNVDRENNIGNQGSVNRNILDEKILEGFKYEITKKLNIYFKKIYVPEKNVSLRITQSWLNYTEMGGFHHTHHHRNSFISGVYYIQTTENDKIMFFSDIKNIFSIDPQEYNIWNSEIYWMPCKEKSLILFPSSLNHSVEPVEKGLRISLSFNTFLVGELGDKLKSNELIL